LKIERERGGGGREGRGGEGERGREREWCVVIFYILELAYIL